VGLDKNGAEKYLFEDAGKIVNLTVINSFQEIYHVERVIDLLAMEMAGVHNVVAGAGRIDGSRAKVRNVGGNLGRILMDGGIAGVEKAVSESAGADGRDGDDVAVPSDVVRRTADGFAVEYGLRRYEVMGLEKDKRKLKATIRIGKCGRMHVDTVDFYSSRDRRQLQQDICSKLDELPDTTGQDLDRILALCEQHDMEKEPDMAMEAGRMQIKAGDMAEAEAFGKSGNLIEKILEDYGRIGFVGKSEDRNKLLCYLAATSRKMGEGNVLSVIILSSSGAGKSALQDATLSLMPPEDVVRLTNLSAKALFYKEKTSLKHKILALEECKAASKEADYAIRTLISSGQLTSEVTVRDAAGRMTTQRNVVDAGSTSVFFTSTNPRQDAETASRFFVVGVDESARQTKEILEHQMNQFTLEGLHVDMAMERTRKKHRNFQRMLKPYAVVNPYRIKFGDTRLQARRLFPQILNLINAVCFLHQMGREVKVDKGVEYIEVDRQDVEQGLALSKEILGRSMNELSMPSQSLLGQIDGYLDRRRKQICRKDKGGATSKSQIAFTRKELRSALGWSSTRLHVCLKELLFHEYVVLDQNGRNRLRHYRLLYDSHGGLAWVDDVGSLIGME